MEPNSRWTSRGARAMVAREFRSTIATMRRPHRSLRGCVAGVVLGVRGVRLHMRRGRSSRFAGRIAPMARARQPPHDACLGLPRRPLRRRGRRSGSPRDRRTLAGRRDIACRGVAARRSALGGRARAAFSACSTARLTLLASPIRHSRPAHGAINENPCPDSGADRPRDCEQRRRPRLQARTARHRSSLVARDPEGRLGRGRLYEDHQHRHDAGPPDRRVDRDRESASKSTK